MCNEKDAIRFEELAELQIAVNEFQNARKSLLEASSIYVLEAHNKKDNSFIKRANDCYKRSRQVIGKTQTKTLTKEQLAKITMQELNEKGDEDKMCTEHTIKTLIEIAKKQEDKDPQKSADNYLEAADMLIKESYEHPSKEEEFVALANKIYLKAKKLKQVNLVGDQQEEFKQASILTKKDNKFGFKDIGGLNELKEQIKFKIIEPFQKPEIFKYYGKSIGGGILMYGPPGCGKSMIARATANEANATFIHVKSSDLKSKFVGETEKNIAELFKRAREAQPTIIFFDEFEVLGGDRTEGQAHERSQVAQLLTEMDGMDSKDQEILLLAATNEPWSIDPALRREGRFGKTLFIPPPDEDARKEIFRINLQNKPVGTIDYNTLADLSKGLSGADIKSACEIATDIPLKEVFETGKKRNLTMKDLKEGIEKTQSIVYEWYKKAKQQVDQKKLQDSFKELVKEANLLERQEAIVV